MKRAVMPLVVLALLSALAFWWFSPVQVLKRRTHLLLETLTLESGSGVAGRQLASYTLNALLAEEVELSAPSIHEANGTFERSELESSFSWLCKQARQTRFDLEKMRSIRMTGDRAEVSFSVTALVELSNHRPVDGLYDVTCVWELDEDQTWRMAGAEWLQSAE